MLATCSAATAQVKVRIGDLAQSLNEIGSRAMIDQGIDKKYGIAAEYKAYPTLDGLFTAIRGKESMSASAAGPLSLSSAARVFRSQ